MVDQCPTLEPQGTQLPPGMACGKEQITKKNIHKRFLACLDFNMLLDWLKNLAPFFSPKSMVTCPGAHFFPPLGQATRTEC